jgi:hypothetical protein
MTTKAAKFLEDTSDYRDIMKGVTGKDRKERYYNYLKLKEQNGTLVRKTLKAVKEGGKIVSYTPVEIKITAEEKLKLNEKKHLKKLGTTSAKKSYKKKHPELSKTEVRKDVHKIMHPRSTKVLKPLKPDSEKKKPGRKKGSKIGSKSSPGKSSKSSRKTVKMELDEIKAKLDKLALK